MGLGSYHPTLSCFTRPPHDISAGYQGLVFNQGIGNAVCHGVSGIGHIDLQDRTKIRFDYDEQVTPGKPALASKVFIGARVRKPYFVQENGGRGIWAVLPPLAGGRGRTAAGWPAYFSCAPRRDRANRRAGAPLPANAAVPARNTPPRAAALSSRTLIIAQTAGISSRRVATTPVHLLFQAQLALE